jgi:gp16 family phage-associated protein
MKREDARRIFDKAGISVAEWARANGFSRVNVHNVLNGRLKCRRGEAHRIAVALGIKDGELIGVNQLTQRLGGKTVTRAKRRAA